MSERAILDALRVDNIRADVEHITQKIPSRLAGSESQRRMAEYSAAKLKAAGIDANVFHIPGLVRFDALTTATSSRVRDPVSRGDRTHP
jgi:hypothetical protein